MVLTFLWNDLHEKQSHCCCPRTCDSVWDAEEAGSPLPRGERLSVVAISETHSQQLLPHSFIPQSIDERVANCAAERQPRHQSLQSLRHSPLSPQSLCTHHPDIWTPSDEEGADHHQDGYKGLALTSSIHKAPPASIRGSWGAWVFTSIPLSSSGVVLGHNNGSAVYFAGFHAGNAENYPVTSEHDE